MDLGGVWCEYDQHMLHELTKELQRVGLKNSLPCLPQKIESLAHLLLSVCLLIDSLLKESMRIDLVHIPRLGHQNSWDFLLCLELHVLGGKFASSAALDSCALETEHIC